VALQNLQFRRKRRTTRTSNGQRAPYPRVSLSSSVLSVAPRRVVVPRPTKVNHSPLEPIVFSSFAKPNQLVAFRSSLSWFASERNKVAIRGIPFITDRGAYSTNCVCYWKSTSAQWFATVLATHYQRLVRWFRRHQGFKIVRKYRDLIFRISLYTCLTDDFGTLERLLQCAVRSVPNTRKYLYKLTSQMDDNQRFLHGLMLKSHSWLQLRAKHARVKFIDFYRLSGLRNLPFTGSKFQRLRGLKEWLDRKADPWVSPPSGKLIFLPSTCSRKYTTR